MRSKNTGFTPLPLRKLFCIVEVNFKKDENEDERNFNEKKS